MRVDLVARGHDQQATLGVARPPQGVCHRRRGGGGSDRGDRQCPRAPAAAAGRISGPTAPFLFLIRDARHDPILFQRRFTGREKGPNSTLQKQGLTQTGGLCTEIGGSPPIPYGGSGIASLKHLLLRLTLLGTFGSGGTAPAPQQAVVLARQPVQTDRSIDGHLCLSPGLLTKMRMLVGVWFVSNMHPGMHSIRKGKHPCS